MPISVALKLISEVIAIDIRTMGPYLPHEKKTSIYMGERCRTSWCMFGLNYHRTVVKMPSVTKNGVGTGTSLTTPTNFTDPTDCPDSLELVGSLHQNGIGDRDCWGPQLPGCKLGTCVVPS